MAEDAEEITRSYIDSKNEQLKSHINQLNIDWNEKLNKFKTRIDGIENMYNFQKGLIQAILIRVKELEEINKCK